MELLRKKTLGENNLEFYYWRNSQNKEVNFIIKENLKVSKALQICWEINRPETRTREIKPLLKVMEKLKINEGFIITQDLEKEENIGEKKIKYLPLWKWLLFDLERY